MFRRGLTVVAWLVGLAAVTYQGVVEPLAHAAFGAEITDERVVVPEPWLIEPIGDATAYPVEEQCEGKAALTEGWRADRI